MLQQVRPPPVTSASHSNFYHVKSPCHEHELVQPGDMPLWEYRRGLWPPHSPWLLEHLKALLSETISLNLTERQTW